MTSNHLRPVEFPSRQQSMIEQTLDVLERTLGITKDDDVRIGGGSVLAAHWHHRDSTDIDFAMPGTLLAKFVEAKGDLLYDELMELKKAGKIKRPRVGKRFFEWTWKELGPVSMSRLSQERRSSVIHVESSRGISLAPIQDILAGKLLGRVMKKTKFEARDGYDLCCAFEYEPKVARKVLKEAMKESMGALNNLINLIETVTKSKKRIILVRPLLQPTHKEFAYDPWGKFAKFAQKEIDRIRSCYEEGLER